MVQSVFPGKQFQQPELPKRSHRLGIELALPLTLLAFIALAEMSPLLKMHSERIIEWLYDHDFIVTGTFTFLFAIPFWMTAVIIKERSGKKR